MGLDVRPQIGLLLGHRLEQQPLLRREVAVDGAERDVGGGATSRICTASNPPPAASSKVAASTRRRRSAWLRASVLRGAGSGEPVVSGSSGRRLPQSSPRNGKHVSIRGRVPGGQRPDTGCETAAMADEKLDVLDLADKLFTGELPIEAHHPFASSGQMAEVQPGLAFVDAFANSAAVDTDDGLVVVDTSGVFHAKAVHETIRSWSPSRLDTAVFTHGHIDHVFGVDLYEEEARERLGPARVSSRTARSPPASIVTSSPPATTA